MVLGRRRRDADRRGDGVSAAGTAARLRLRRSAPAAAVRARAGRRRGVCCGPPARCGWRPSGTLVVADLHLEKGSAYAARGQLLPPYDTRETLARLAAEAAQLTPRASCCWATRFHDGGRRGAARRPRTSGRCGRWRAVADADLDRRQPRRATGRGSLPGERSPRLSVAGLTLRPRAARPAPRRARWPATCIPAPGSRAAPAAVRRRCFVTDGERLVLPAFGAYRRRPQRARRRLRAPVRAAAPLAVALGERRAHAVGWTQLGPD